MNKAKVVLPVAKAMKHLQFEFISTETFDFGNVLHVLQNRSSRMFHTFQI